MKFDNNDWIIMGKLYNNFLLNKNNNYSNKNTLSKGKWYDCLVTDDI